MNIYQIVLADPPWPYNIRKNPNTRFGLGMHGHYPPMSVAAICALPVKSIVAENAALFLWAVGPKLNLAFNVLEDWGFRYATIGFTWIKTTKGGEPGKDGTAFRFLPGYYTGSNVELCLLGIRGSMPVADNAVRQIIAEPPREHSRKPDCARDRIVQLFGDIPRIEMFARERVPGWDAHGDQVEDSVTISAA